MCTNIADKPIMEPITKLMASITAVIAVVDSTFAELIKVTNIMVIVDKEMEQMGLLPTFTIIFALVLLHQSNYSFNQIEQRL